jgi:hypothetical protein
MSWTTALTHWPRRAVGTLWIIHGALLVVCAALFWLLAYLIDVIMQTNPEALYGQQRAIELAATVGPLAPWSLLIGCLALPLGILFIRRVSWSLPVLGVMTWLHVVAMPLLHGWALAAGSPLAGADAKGVVLNLAFNLAMLVGLVCCGLSLRRQALREEFNHNALR